MKLKLNLFQIREQIKQSQGGTKYYGFSLSSYGNEPRLEIEYKGATYGLSSQSIRLPLEDAVALRDYLNSNLGNK